MDKSGRKTLTNNVAALIERAGGSRLALAKALRMDVKALERVAKDAHGEKGVGIAFIDELALRLELEAWQLLVPDLDPTNPPTLADGSQERPAPPTESFDVELLAKVLARLDPQARDEVSSALSDLARYPDSRMAVQRARNALVHGGLKGIPSWRETAIELLAEAKHRGKKVDPETLISDIDATHSEWLTRVSAKSARKTLTES